MIGRIVRNDLRRGFGASGVLFGFFLITALLACGGAATTARLLGSVDALFVAASVPDVVQLTTGEVDRAQVAAFADRDSEVVDWQLATARVATGESLWFGAAPGPDSSSVVEHYFVTQNQSFDRLLDLNNQPVNVRPGQIGVPVYDLVRHGLAVGDTVRVLTPAGEQSFTIATFVRDAQMNPALISSKRFVVAAADLAKLERILPSTESLVEFRLAPGASTDQFRDRYRSAGLPQAGPTVDAGLLRSAAFLSDGLTVVVLVLVSALLLIVGIICLRFAVASAIQAAAGELGVLRAIGAPLRFIRRAFAAKYLLLAAAGSVLGWAGAVLATPALTAGAVQATGGPDSPVGMLVAAGVVAVLLFGITALSCWLAVRSVGKVSAAGALRVGTVGGSIRLGARWRLSSSRVPVAWQFALRDLYLRPRFYLVPLAVFTLAAVLVIVPVNFLTTTTSPAFIQYLGVGQSDLRLDAPVSASPNLGAELASRLDSDPSVERAAQFATYRCPVADALGAEASTLVETGDFSLFPIAYLEGRPPQAAGEVALSYLNASELAKSVGDELKVRAGDGWRGLAVVGVYQDITNGGKTAKASGELSCGQPIWITATVDAASGADLAQLAAAYSSSFEGLRAYPLGDYVTQTLGQTVSSLAVAVRAAVVVSAVVVALIAAMFTGVLAARDSEPNLVLRKLGAPGRLVRHQYLLRLVLLLVVGVALGTVLANTLGQLLVGALMSTLGAPGVQFEINPLVAYLACPALLVLAVAGATALAVHLRIVRTRTH